MSDNSTNLPIKQAGAIVTSATVADLPPIATEGDCRWVEDVNLFYVYYDGAWAAAGGGVSGPGSSTDNALVRWDGIGGDTLQSSSVTVDDSGNISLPALSTVDGRDISVDGTAQDNHIAASTGVHGVSGSVVGTSDSQTLTNKSINADNNTITNIDNADIKAAAAIDATKIADGSVTNAEFQYIGGLTSDAQTQISAKIPKVAATDNAITRFDGTGGDVQNSLVTISDTGSISLPVGETVDGRDISADGSSLDTHVGASSGVHGVTGAVVGTTDSQTLTNKTLGSTNTITGATAASLTNGGTVTIPSGTDTLVTLTATQTLTNKTLGATNTLTGATAASFTNGGTVTLPTGTVTLADTSSSQTLTNKNLSDSTTFIVDATIPTKRLQFDIAGTAGTTTTLIASATTDRSINLPDATTNLVGHDTTQTLTNKTLGVTNTLTNATATAFTSGGNTVSLPTTTDTLVGRATTDTLTNKTLTTPTIATPVIDDYMDINEEAAPGTPASGKVRLYAKTDGKLYLKDDAGTETELGSSGGAGEINAITNPDAATDTTGWSDDANHTISRITSGSPLDPIVPTAFRITSTATASAESSTSGGYSSFTLPVGLESKKLKVEFYVVVPATETWRLSVYDGTTRLALSTDSSSVTTLPAGFTGKFTSYFDTTTNNTYTVSLTKAVGTGTTVLDFTSIIVGPGIQPQGAAVGPYSSYAAAATTTITAATTAPTLGTNTANLVSIDRVGNWAEITWEYRQTAAGSAGSGIYQFKMPTGLTIDTAISGSGDPNTDNAGIGSCGILSVSSAVSEFSYHARVFSSTLIAFRTFAGGGGGNWASSSTLNFGSTAFHLSLKVRVPIAEWAGSGTLNVAQNDVEFAWNSDTSNANNTTAFAYGPGGVAFGSYTGGIEKTVRFQTPIQATDAIVIEVESDTTSGFDSTWSADGQGIITSTGRLIQNTLSYGMWLTPVSGSSTDVKVTFGDGGRLSSGATYGAAGAPWSGITDRRWRLKKVKAGAAVGFGIVVPGTSSGLVSASGLPGSTTGNAIASGYVGEVKTSTISTFANHGATGTFDNITTLSMTAGIWTVSGNLINSHNGATSPTDLRFAISGYSGNTTTDHTKTLNVVEGEPSTSGNSNSSLSITPFMVRCDGTNLYIGSFTIAGTTLYLKSAVNYTGSTPQRGGSITAVRIA